MDAIISVIKLTFLSKSTLLVKEEEKIFCRTVEQFGICIMKQCFNLPRQSFHPLLFLRSPALLQPAFNKHFNSLTRVLLVERIGRERERKCSGCYMIREDGKKIRSYSSRHEANPHSFSPSFGGENNSSSSTN